MTAEDAEKEEVLRKGHEMASPTGLEPVLPP